MNRSKNKKGKSSQIPLFISKLIEMLDNDQIVSIIGWTHTQDSFNIKNITKFIDEVLPLYFKHRNFSSFIRQLNMYGFRKIRHSDGQNVYQNQNFKRRNHNLLKNINRKIKQQKEQSLVVYQGGSKSDNNRQIQQLKLKQKGLEQMCKQFMMQNQKIVEQNQKIIKKLQQESRQKDKKLQTLLMIMMAQRGNKQLPYMKEQLLSLPNSQNSPSFKYNHKQMPAIENQYNYNNMQILLNILKNSRNSLNQQNVMKPQNQLQLIQRLSQNDNISVSKFQLQRSQSDFMSINDFINAQNYQNDLNLEQSV